MRLEYTDEQEQLRDEIRATMQQVMTPQRQAAVSERAEGGPAMRDCVRALAAADLLGVGWPKEFGGRGFSAIEQFIFGEEARRVNAPIPLVTLNTVGPTLMHYGTEEQKQTFLPAILDGSVEFAIGYSEPDAGSDLASLRTTAVRDGDEWVVNGQKMFTSGAAYADYIWLAARTDPNTKKHKGISIFIVPTSSPGFSCQPLRTMPGVSTFYTFYDNVRVPASAIVAGENQGWQLITTQLNSNAPPWAIWVRSSHCWSRHCVGARHRTRRWPGHRQTLGAIGAGPGRGRGRGLQTHQPAGECGHDPGCAEHG